MPEYIKRDDCDDFRTDISKRISSLETQAAVNNTLIAITNKNLNAIKKCLYTIAGIIISYFVTSLLGHVFA